MFSRLARQILNIFGTKIRKRVPHDMEPVLATNWPTFYDLVHFLFFLKCACSCAELLGYPKNECKQSLMTTNHVLRYLLLSCSSYWSPVENRGIYKISLVRPSQLTSKTAPTIFLIFGMKLGIHKGSIVTESLFWKKVLVGRKWGKSVKK